MPFEHAPISRRTVARGVAWSVPAVAAAAAAPALSASEPQCPDVDVRNTLTHHCETESGTDLGMWRLTTETTIPSCTNAAGEGFRLGPFTMTLTLPEEFSDRLRGEGFELINGSLQGGYTLSGVMNGEEHLYPSIPSTTIPESGPITATFTDASTPFFRAPPVPGTILLKVKSSFLAYIGAPGHFGFDVTSTLDPAAQSTLLGAITVLPPSS